MAYGGRKYFGNESIQDKIWKYTQSHPELMSRQNKAQNNLQGTSFAYNSFNGRVNSAYTAQLLPHNNSKDILRNEPQPLLRNILFNNYSSPNRKRPQSSTATNQHELYGKRQRLFAAEEASEGKYSQITEQVESYTRNHSQSQQLLDKKLKLRSALLSRIRKQFPQASLYLVGSSCNGFASNVSDADFCAMISHVRKIHQSHEARDYLRAIERLIRAMGSLKGIKFIPAKVPILKFKDTISGCECDINVNNDMGIRNTHLLRTYSKVDERVKPLVMAIKRWGKARKINDASQGTLSSYALVLMILHYLQSGCNPPVLPSLQQKYPQYFKVDSNVEELPMFEPANMIPCNNSSNKESVGQLLEGFFRYFAERFSWDTQIISVRDGCTLLKKNYKDFQNKYICVEEPFEFYNTARSVYELSQFRLIKKEFQRAYGRLKEKLSLEYIL